MDWLTCFLEILQGFRPDLAYLASLTDLRDGDDDPSLPTDAQIARDARTVNRDWLRKKAKQTLIVSYSEAVPGTDLTDLATRERLRDEMGSELAALGVRDLDLSTVTSSDRAVTQRIARYLYEYINGDGMVLYTSRFGCDYTCVAVFEDARFHTTDHPRPIAFDDPDLIEALRLFGLVLQTDTVAE